MKLSALSKMIIAAAMGAVVAGCGTGTVIKDDGTTDEPKWHEADRVIFNKDRGTFPNPAGLAQVRSGMTKDQLYELLGRPQYHDGWRPREWNYLFHFTTPGVGTDNVTTCQYKVLFDSDMYARSFYWNPVDPADGVCPPAKPAAASPAPAAMTFTLGADALFAFDRSGPNDINAKGKKALEKLAHDLKAMQRIDAVVVEGHTDRLGSAAYNNRLSQQRANTVRNYLIGQGIDASLVTAKGYGKTKPVKECAQSQRGELVKCLAPNRRVVVEVKGVTGKVAR